MTNSLEPELRLALISDVHHGPSFEAKAGPRALGVLREVLTQVDASGAQMLLDLGDRINNASAEEDERYMGEVAEVMRGSRLPRHHLLGNHDIKLLESAANARLLGQSVGSRVLRHDGWNLVLWSAQPRFRLAGCEVAAEDVDWLRRTLNELDGPAVLFSHVPLGGGAMGGNYYFEGAPERGASYRDLSELQDLVVGCPHLKLAVAGHVHWNSLHTVDGVPFLTLQSLSELATTWPEPAAAWGELSLRPDHARLQVHGLDPWMVEVPLRPSGRHWLRRPGLPSRGPSVASADLGQVRGVLLDLDGVMYRGHERLPGARRFLSTLRESGRGVVAVTNHAGIDARQLWHKLQGLGIDLAPEEIVTSIDATVAHLRSEHPGASVLAWGSEALRKTLDAEGFLASDLPEVVVVGYRPDPDLAALAAAAEAVARGAAFVGTNPDRWLPAPGGRLPEAGAYLAMVTALSGQRPFVVGKPNAAIAELALARLGISAGEAMVVGDTLETDIATAHTVGAASALLLTGNTAVGDLLLPRPDHVFADLPALAAALAATPMRGRSAA